MKLFSPIHIHLSFSLDDRVSLKLLLIKSKFIRFYCKKFGHAMIRELDCDICSRCAYCPQGVITLIEARTDRAWKHNQEMLYKDMEKFLK